MVGEQAALGVEVSEGGQHLALVAVAAAPGAHAGLTAGAPIIARASLRLAPPLGVEAVVAGITALVGRVAALPARAPGLTVALWDPVDAAHGRVPRLPLAPGWRDVALADLLAARLGESEVRLAPAAGTAAVAEARRGAGQGARLLLYVVSGRGVWSALTLEGRLVAGNAPAAGQLGHARVRADGPRCSCGAQGHLEPLAAAQAIVRNAIGRAAASEESAHALRVAAGGRTEAATVAQVAALAAAGEPAAKAVLTEAVAALAEALAGLVLALAPDAIVLGGPLGAAGAALLAPLRQALTAALAPVAPAPPLSAGAFDPPPAALGAALLAAERMIG